MAAILNENGYGNLRIFKWCIGDKPPVVLPVRVLCCTGLASYGDITKIGIPSPASRSHHSPHPFTDDIEMVLPDPVDLASLFPDLLEGSVGLVDTAYHVGLNPVSAVGK